MIRTVPTGDLGLDVLLGGGWRLVTRLPGQASATVVVRGGSGAGKTLVGLQVAIELARALEGDIAVACVEILPTEYAAQISSARDDLDQSFIVVMPASADERPTKVASSEDGPRFFVGLLTDLDPEEPDLVASLETLDRDVKREGGNPVVFIVDSLIEGYGIGANASRMTADALMKFAAEDGRGLVLCEEEIGQAPSPWVFAADTVLQLGVESLARRRWIEVRKHRFGPSSPGRHDIDLVGASRGPAVFPEPDAWVERGLSSLVFDEHRADEHDQPAPPLIWGAPMTPREEVPPVEGSFVFITAPDAEVARSLAYSLRPQSSWSKRRAIELDPLIRDCDLMLGPSDDVDYQSYVSTQRGATRALRWFIECFLDAIHDYDGTQSTCIVVGDLGLVLDAPDAATWIDMVRTFAALVSDSGCGAAVLAYDGRTRVTFDARIRLAADADVAVIVLGSGGSFSATVSTRRPRRTSEVSWVRPSDLPGEAELGRPRTPGRATTR